jgi:hypothetical protein
MFKRLFLIAISGVALASTLSACVVAPVGRPGYVHDRDRDGVPNRYDNRPDNPYRR